MNCTLDANMLTMLGGSWFLPPISFLPMQIFTPNQMEQISMGNNEKCQQNGIQKLEGKRQIGEAANSCQIIGQNRKMEEERMAVVDRIGESARNRFGRPYISGRPLLLCDRKKIVRLYCEGRRKIAIAREIGITHSCVSKVIRRYEETGEFENKGSRTASCACPGEAENHDLRVCRHVRFNRFRAEQQKEQKIGKILAKRQKQKLEKEISPLPKEIEQMPKKFSIEWILSGNIC